MYGAQMVPVNYIYIYIIAHVSQCIQCIFTWWHHGVMSHIAAIMAVYYNPLHCQTSERCLSNCTYCLYCFYFTFLKG